MEALSPASEDAGWVLRVARAEDQEAFARLYDRHAPMVFGLACRMLGQRPEAEDALQEVFFSLWRRAASYDPAKGPVAAWLLVIARSRCIDRLRRRSRRQDREHPIETEDGPLSLAEPGAPVLEDMAAAERRAAAVRALGALPPEQRAALEAAYFEGLTQREIAQKWEIPLGTVKTRMRLGLSKLAGLLSAERTEP